MNLRYGWFLGGILILTAWLHSTVHYLLFSLIPLPVVIPIILTWTAPNAWIFLAIWAITAELFSTLPPGLLAIITFLPWIIRLLIPRVTADLSFTFLAVIVCTVLVQVAAVVGYDLITTGWPTWPWPVLSWMIVLCSLFTATATIAWYQVKPYDY